jgi:hypothetical protein
VVKVHSSLLLMHPVLLHFFSAAHMCHQAKSSNAVADRPVNILTSCCGLHLLVLCLQAAADAAADAQPAGRSKAARGKAGSKGKAGAAAGQSPAAVAAAAMLQEPQQLQLAGLLAVMAGMSPQVGYVELSCVVVAG